MKEVVIDARYIVIIFENQTLCDITAKKTISEMSFLLVEQQCELENSLELMTLITVLVKV